MAFFSIVGDDDGVGSPVSMNRISDTISVVVTAFELVGGVLSKSATEFDGGRTFSLRCSVSFKKAIDSACKLALGNGPFGLLPGHFFFIGFSFQKVG